MSSANEKVTLSDLIAIAQDFVHKREWDTFHSPKNLAMNIAIEAGEIMEHFLWCSTEESYDQIDKKRIEIENEMADVLLTLLLLAKKTNTDLTAAFLRKLEETKKKYPVEKCRGVSTKYNKL